MRILRINGYDVDIDEKTAIGITFQKYDITDPATRKIKFSNTFSIPNTAKNLNIIGYGNNSQTLSTKIYDKFTCSYWLDNVNLIDEENLRITEINDRINFYLYQKESFWDEIKNYRWVDMIEDYLQWLYDEKNWYVLTDDNSNYYSGTFASFIGEINTSDYLRLSHLYTDITISDFEQPPGGNLCIFIKSIFEFLENKYSISFNLTSTENVWSDVYASNIYVWASALLIVNFNLEDKWAISRINEGNESTSFSLAFNNLDKSVYDLVKSFMQLFNLVIIDDYVDNVYTIDLFRFDDIQNKDTIKLPGKIWLEKTKFKPYIKGFEQNNYIKYESVPENFGDTYGAINIPCLNKNLNEVSDLFKIDAYYPAISLNSDNDAIINLVNENAFETFVFLISDNQTTSAITINFGSPPIGTYIGALPLAANYGIANEYLFIKEILEYPRFFEIEAWLSIADIFNLDFFKQYYIPELGGSYFINKISGFNPEKSNKPTKLEVFKVSDKVPKPVDVYLESFYVDGVENAFVDADGNYFV